MDTTQQAVLAGGCFWCIEAVFKRLRGVEETIAGYALGDDDITEPAESIKITFDPEAITYKQLLEVFWKLHDPTSLNKQNNDIGPQYRSAIFVLDEEQLQEAKKSLEIAQKDFDKPIVTVISNLKTFDKADESHQDFYDKNRNAPYCKIIIDPKIQKLEKGFSDKLKENATDPS